MRPESNVMMSNVLFSEVFYKLEMLCKLEESWKTVNKLKIICYIRKVPIMALFLNS